MMVVTTGKKGISCCLDTIALHNAIYNDSIAGQAIPEGHRYLVFAGLLNFSYPISDSFQNLF